MSEATASTINYNAVREQVLAAAREGRCTMVPAGARHNATALILIDGEVIGQASSFGHYVREEPGQKGTFSEKRMVPEYEHLLPLRLRQARN